MKPSTWENRACPDLLSGQDVPSSRREGIAAHKSLDEKTVRRSKSSENVFSSDSYIEMSDFAVEGTAGEGSFGTVFKAAWKANGRIVALKALKPREDFLSIVPESELRGVYKNIYDAFKREIKFLEQAGKHPNVISLLGKSKDYKLCALEIACCDLFQLVRSARKTLPLGIAHTVATGVLQGVAHLHDIGIIHQDIKSSNILLDDQGRAKLCDFGLAMATRGEVKVDREIITLWYRAPELLMGCGSYDKSVDDWAVGCILLEMLVGGVAFPGDPAESCSCDSSRHLNFNRDQLGRIFKVVGTPTVDPKTYACYGHFSKWPVFPCSLQQLIVDSCRDRAAASSRIRSGPAALSATGGSSLAEWTAVVQDMLAVHRDQRTSCAEALRYSLFRPRTSKAKTLPSAVSEPPSPSSLPSRGSSPIAKRSGAGEPLHKSVPQNSDQLLRQLCGFEERDRSSGRLPSLTLPTGAEESERNRGLDSRRGR